ncbi:MAG: hypothetical protein PHI06_08605 [Desulfobulbaceae bacterium]|nr:hypothetical protein [Desulfobulbaceae bacterium]
MNNQQGAALLAFVMVLLVASSFLLLKALGNNSIERDKITSMVLAQAKDALIGSAVMDSERPGRLPCPDSNDDGLAEPFDGNDCPTYIGRLPWRSLGIAESLDSSGQRLWYAISPSLGNNNLALPINSLTAGELTAGAESQLAAVILAPGQPVSGQTARPSNSAADYLEGSNADGDTSYSVGIMTNSFNDRLLTISPEELFRVVGNRVLSEVRGTPTGGGLRKYYFDNHEYPWAATAVDGVPSELTQSGFVPHTVLPFNPSTQAWLANNGWFALITYAVAADFQPQTSYPQACTGGCLSVGTYNEAQAKLTLSPGSSVEKSIAVCSANPNVICP